MPDMNSLQDWVNTTLGAIGGGAVSFFALRRKYSQDSTAIAYDKTQTDFVAKLMAAIERANAERDTFMRIAEKTTEQRLIDVGRIARFEALMEAGEKETNRLREELFAMRLHTRKLTAIIVRLDPQAAHMLQVDSNGDGIDLEIHRQGPDTVGNP